MERQASEVGIVIACNAEGLITEVLRDNAEILGINVVGRSLATVFDRGSLGKALNFINEIKKEGAAFDWQLSITAGGILLVLNLAGIFWNEGILIVGARSSQSVENLIDDLMEIGNEQANRLRTAIKANSEQVREKKELEAELYDELGKLNNELANLQRELLKKNIELEKLNEEKNRFLGMAAHDLRNPLHAIQMYSEFLLDETSDVVSQEHRQFMEIIHASSEFMLRLVNDLLDVAKIESGKLELDLAETDLISLIEKNVAMNNVLASRKNIAINSHHVGEAQPLVADAAKLEQALTNLVTNAVKFSNPGGKIDVTLEFRQSEVVISVQDEGQGIPESEQGKLFQPFQRISVKSTGGEDSTGLGLAIVKKVVLGHKGRVWVESEIGKGSTFFIALPKV